MDKKLKIYNTLIDRREASPISRSDKLWSERFREIESVLAKFEVIKWTELPPSLTEKVMFAMDFWSASEYDETMMARLNHLAAVRSWDGQVAGWQAYAALETMKWEALDKLADRVDKSLWKYVAEVNMGRKSDVLLSGCQVYFKLAPKAFVRPSPNECDDEMLIKLLSWLQESDKNKRSRLKESFLRAYTYDKIDFDISRSNFINSLNWGADTNTPSEPSLAALYLALPQNRKYSRIVEKRLK